jgi:uncharacterized RDD family membrane protein YckC
MTIASIPKRLLADIIDLAIFLSLFIIIYLGLLIQYDSFHGKTGNGYRVGLVVPVISVYFTLLISWTVFIILSEFMNGQSIGKRFAKIKVVREDLSNTTIFQTMIRHLFDTIDMLLLVGLVIAFTNKDRQRIGDLVAKTIVVVK